MRASMALSIPLAMPAPNPFARLLADSMAILASKSVALAAREILETCVRIKSRRIMAMIKKSPKSPIAIVTTQ